LEKISLNLKKLFFRKIDFTDYRLSSLRVTQFRSSVYRQSHQSHYWSKLWRKICWLSVSSDIQQRQIC